MPEPALLLTFGAGLSALGIPIVAAPAERPRPKAYGQLDLKARSSLWWGAGFFFLWPYLGSRSPTSTAGSDNSSSAFTTARKRAAARPSQTPWSPDSVTFMGDRRLTVDDDDPEPHLAAHEHPGRAKVDVSAQSTGTVVT